MSEMYIKMIEEQKEEIDRYKSIVGELFAEIKTLKGPDSYKAKTMDQIEREAILSTLKFCENSKVKASAILEIGIRTLLRKLEKYEDEGYYEHPSN